MQFLLLTGIIWLNKTGLTFFQCFGSIFIESGSSKKSRSGFGSRKALNPDPSNFFTLSEKNLNYVIIIIFIIKKRQLKDTVVKVTKKLNYVMIM